jgi:hypothetical protein
MGGTLPVRVRVCNATGVAVWLLLLLLLLILLKISSCTSAADWD